MRARKLNVKFSFSKCGRKVVIYPPNGGSSGNEKKWHITREVEHG